MVVTAFGLLVLQISRRRDLGDLASPGVLAAAFFASYVALHALFPYSGFRYASAAVPLLVGSVALLSHEARRGRSA